MLAFDRADRRNIMVAGKYFIFKIINRFWGGVTMILQNEICHIEINIDETYTVDSVDNRHYDVILNPEHYRHNDLSKTLSIHIGLYAREFRVALIGPYHSYEIDFNGKQII